MLWYGRWVTSYKDNDDVQFILNENGKIGIGKIKLPDDYFTQNWFIVFKNTTLTKKDVICVSPYEHWYKDNQEKMYDAVLNNWLRKERK